jgi:hypothetical protein
VYPVGVLKVYRRILIDLLGSDEVNTMSSLLTCYYFADI